MADLPEDVNVCYLAGDFSAAVIDSFDAGTRPDTPPFAGLNVKVRALPKDLPLTHRASHREILFADIDTYTDAAGRIVDGQGNPWIAFVAPSASLSPGSAAPGEPWKVTVTVSAPAGINFPSRSKTFVPLPSTPGEPLQWTDIIEVAPSTPAELEALQQVLAEVAAGRAGAEAARNEALVVLEQVEEFAGTNDEQVAAMLDDQDSAAGSTLRTLLALNAPDYFTAAFLPPEESDIPTITMTTYSLGAGEQLVREKRVGNVVGAAGDIAGDTHFLYDGMLELTPEPANTAQFVTVPLLPGGDAQAARYQFRVRTIVAKSATVKIRLRLKASSIGFRIKVNGAWISDELTRFSDLTAGGTYLATLTFPNAATRTIEYEDAGSSSFGGMVISTTGTLTRAPAPNFRLAILGDSITGGSSFPPDGATRLETYAARVAHLLGAESYINFGVGGTSYQNGDPATRFGARVPAILQYDPDIVITFGSRNDGTGGSQSITDAVVAVLNGLQDVPEVYVVGMITAAHTGNNESVRAAAIEVGRPFIDPIAAGWIDPVKDIGEDGVHPTFVGHRRIARGLYEGYKANPDLSGGTTPPDPTVYTEDTFERADFTGTNFGTSSGGQSWFTLGTTGLAGIASGQAIAYASSATLIPWWMNSAVADGILHVELGAAGAEKRPSIINAFTDGSNYVRFYGDGTSWAILKRVGGANTVIASGLAPVADNDVVEWTRQGTTHTIKVNGAEVWSGTIAEQATAAGHGFIGFNSTINARYKSIRYSQVL